MSKRKAVLPGHMKKTIDRVEELAASVDLALEVVDARAPESSRCKILSKMLSGSHHVKILSKIDLANPAITKSWIKYYENNGLLWTALPFGVRIPADKFVTKLKLPDDLLAEGRMLKALIIGIPNVGKSTLTNILVGKKSAPTGAKPGITRGVQLVKISDGFFLFDTPGVINPTIRSEEHANVLGLIGCLQDHFFDPESAALLVMSRLIEYSPQVVEKAYDIRMPVEIDATAVIDSIALRRGFLLKGGVPDFPRACRVIVTDFQTGRLKGISLELPPEE